MSDTDLTDKYIADTFDGLLHASGEPLPATGRATIYDGLGNKSAISLGREAEGVKISTKLSIDNIEYPTAGSPSGTGVVVQTSPYKVEILQKLPLSYLEDAATPEEDPTTSTTYTGYINSMTVNSKGIVTAITSAPFPVQQTTSPSLLPNAYGHITYEGLYHVSENQNGAFSIYGINIRSITWISRGFYRVHFETPMGSSNYSLLLQNTIQSNMAREGQVNKVDESTWGVRSSEDPLIVGYKSPDFFEFWCWTEEGNLLENMSAMSLMVFGG